MADIMNIKIGDQNPDAIMFNQYYVEEYKNIVTFGSIVPKNNSNSQPNFSQVNRTEWQVNDGWEVEIIDENTLRINKFKIDTWGLRLVTSDIGNIVSNRLRIRVEGLTYVNDNFITHTPGSDTPDGFTKAYAGTGGFNVYWYPGQFTSGKYATGLCIQQGIGYAANENECDDSFQMGKHPWDMSQVGITQDGIITGNWSDNSYKAVTIGLFGGYQTATSWHDETNGAYKQYIITDHPIILHLDGIESSTAAIDYSSRECWDVYCGNGVSYHIYHKDKTVDNCLYKHGYLDDITIGDRLKVIYKTLNTTNIKGYRSSNAIYVPIVTDIMDNWLYTEHNTDTVSMTMPAFNISVSNTELWDYVKDWAKNQGIYCENEPYSYGMQQFMNVNIDELELKILQVDGPINTRAYSRQFANSTISKLTLTYDKSYTTFTSANTLFYQMGKLTTIINASDHPIGSFDNSGCFEFCRAITSIPGITNWDNITSKPFKINYNNQTIYAQVNACYCQYCFEYCTNLVTIERRNGNEDRFSEYNTIVAAMLVQVFNGCNNLVTIDPVLDVKFIRPGINTNSLAHLAFAGCDKVEDIRIKNLNHMDWRFDNSNDEHGNLMGYLPSLNQESIIYLFDNLKDLNLCGTVIPELDENNNVLNHDEFLECPAVDHANIYCPEQWADKITQEMINAAAAKNWGIYIGGVLKEPTQLDNILFNDSDEILWNDNDEMIWQQQ